MANCIIRNSNILTYGKLVSITKTEKPDQIAGTHNPEDNMLRREYEAMRKEAKWADALRPTK